MKLSKKVIIFSLLYYPLTLEGVKLPKSDKNRVEKTKIDPLVKYTGQIVNKTEDTVGSWYVPQNQQDATGKSVTDVYIDADPGYYYSFNPTEGKLDVDKDTVPDVIFGKITLENNAPLEEKYTQPVVVSSDSIGDESKTTAVTFDAGLTVEKASTVKQDVNLSGNSNVNQETTFQKATTLSDNAKIETAANTNFNTLNLTNSNSSATLGNNTTTTVNQLSVSKSSTVALGSDSKLTAAEKATFDNAKLTAGNNSTATFTKGLTATSGTTVTLGTAATLEAKDTTTLAASTLTVGDKSTATFAKELTASSGTTVTFGTGTALNAAENATFTASTLRAGNNSTATFEKGLTATSGTTVTLGSAVTLEAKDTTTLTNSTFTAGNSSSLVLRAFNAAASTVTLGSQTTLTASEKSTIDGGALILGQGASLDFRKGADIKAGTTFEVSGGAKVNFSKDVNLDRLEVKQQADSTFKFTGATASFNNVKITGGNVIFDPTTQIFKSNSVNTLPSTTLGSHTPEDSYNAFIFEPGSTLDITGTLTLNNVNILVLAYKEIAEQNATQILTATNIVGGNATDSGKFDHIFTVNLDSAGIPDPKTFSPIDTTINVQNPDGTISIYEYGIDQTSTGISYSVKKVSKTSAGTNLDSIVQELFSTNPNFRTYLNGDPTPYQYAYRVDTKNVMDSMLTALENAKNSNAMAYKPAYDSFKSKNIFATTKNTSDRVVSLMEVMCEDITEIMCEDGPIDEPILNETINKKDMRVWISPFMSFRRESGDNPQNSWLLGSLFGGETRSEEYRYTFGLLAGFNISKAKGKLNTQTGHDLTGITLGTYGSYGAWEGGRLDSQVLFAINDIKQVELSGQDLLRNNHKSYDTMFDVQASHLIRWGKKEWSIRFDIGNTFTNSKQSRYSRYRVDTGANMGAIDPQRNYSSELYSGIGLRWNNVGEVWRTRITGVYEFGHEYLNKGDATRIHYGQNFALQTVQPYSGTQQNTHYLTLYTSLNDKNVDKNNGWKFVGGYLGKFQKNVIDTSFYIKAEYRF
jgi:hypothetical protein